MLDYKWPGNIRQLKNVLESLYVVCPDAAVADQDLNFNQIEVKQDDQDIFSGLINLPLKEARQKLISQFEMVYLERNLEIYSQNISKLAEAVGESREGLSKKIKRYGLKHKKD